MLKKIKVLIVDDSALMRRLIREILQTERSIEVIGTARDGADAIEKVRQLKPDVITMDINMPIMDGLTSMQYILDEFPEIQVIILSSLTEEGKLITLEALELGAFDYIAKPSGTVSINLHVIGREIIEKITAAYKYSRKNRMKKKAVENKKNKVFLIGKKTTSARVSTNVSKVVVIGISTGGPKTLMEILPDIPEDLNAAIIVIQHMPPSFTSTFVKRIDAASPFSFKEAQAGDVIANRRGFLAPGGFQLLVRQSKYKGEYMIRLTKSPSTLFMPSVDVTMDSVLECFGGKNTIGVLMTGMGDDGANSMVRIRKAGGITIAQDEATSVVFGMPREAIERGGAEIVVPSYRIPEEIIKAIKR
ncbi:protein-glutamate methylesterase/protein-glutamine glutaminase [Clostridium magnum]|uniref:Protein-glutamate methylesterase/protein-glutamine glutaminase n=1 Tax=Clostridium magnum DSM 2767 TaxID=1121326 RepID=A0A162T7X8_9CLOT|nr:chemotaxis response regulator protein-glutamate methylesterase [Clostridium magnum]KZL92341.1 chemotaxis response regulator protein-glutamate methylesterase [Clostridium magnum DSM 2767]SHH12809.1 two-component system, chemotaxis family, response regulator CheB [Clostridium magnum DSM 2767]